MIPDTTQFFRGGPVLSSAMPIRNCNDDQVSKNFADCAYTGLECCVSRNRWSTMLFVNVSGLDRGHILISITRLGFSVHSKKVGHWYSRDRPKRGQFTLSLIFLKSSRNLYNEL